MDKTTTAQIPEWVKFINDNPSYEFFIVYKGTYVVDISLLQLIKPDIEYQVLHIDEIESRPTMRRNASLVMTYDLSTQQEVNEVMSHFYVDDKAHYVTLNGHRYENTNTIDAGITISRPGTEPPAKKIQPYYPDMDVSLYYLRG